MVRKSLQWGQVKLMNTSTVTVAADLRAGTGPTAVKGPSTGWADAKAAHMSRPKAGNIQRKRFMAAIIQGQGGGR
jgi:hypothetical protein